MHAGIKRAYMQYKAYKDIGSDALSQLVISLIFKGANLIETCSRPPITLTLKKSSRASDYQLHSSHCY